MTETNRYTFDGEPTTLADFIDANDFDAPTIAALCAMEPGDVRRFGGGSEPASELRCEAPAVGGCRCTVIVPSPTNPLAVRFAVCPVHDAAGAIRCAS